MWLTLIAVLNAALVALSLSVDSFVTGFAYGTKNIKIPMRSIQIVNIICSSVIGVSMIAGSLLEPFIPDRLGIVLSFTCLFIIGLIKLLDSVAKTIVRKHLDLNKELKFSIFSIKFLLKVFADPEAADLDASKTISSLEAVILALSLSIDGLAVGFGVALTGITLTDVLLLTLFSLITNMTLIMLGHFIGRKASQKSSHNISWLGGVILICIAISKFF